ncbi:hypothetical protein L226DRAFT_530917 [Lentinus tigrinus ALCF2SS1-7]|uniref:Tetraspannin-domain-containing protein n=1 Tax=Lentinus tigrinus ALCF2SS1-6 TaxID=1328759 RepID=A0A5C2SPT2_9APHY|nr:hypothetical protein L227DRAFT_570827 [Lentinus tigrinus ALCF2SS1-6]RPD79089.1 hypothetical protein L226DRAFT_530917 [Lentinus tigrinus ALCF2SS1-7]
MSKHFCCCIPVRFAVFFFSLLSFLAAGASAALGWFIVYLINTNQLDKAETNLSDDQKKVFEDFVHKYKWGFIVAALIFTFICLMSFFGFIGSIVRNRRMVKAYSYMTILIFVLGSVATGFVLYLTWSERSFCTTIDGTKTCIQSNLNTGSKIGFTIGSVIQWLIDLYIVVAIRRYYEQLEEEREYRHDFRLKPTSGGTYEAKEGLMTQGHYPYSDNTNAFGSNSHA